MVRKIARTKKENEVTQSDVARELNISVVSVSNALSGRKGVSDELRQRILDAADELGYRRKNQRVEDQKKTVRIGILISKKYLGGASSFYMNLYQKIVISANKRKIFTFLEILDEEEEAAGKKPDLITNGQVDGIMVIGELNMRYTKMLKEDKQIPMVFVDFYRDIPEADFIISDGYTGTCQLTRKLIDAGYKKIAFVGTLQATSSILDRYLGYRKAMMEHDLELRDDWIVDDRKDCENELEVKLPEKMPKAFVCNCDRTASVLIRELKKYGYRVPEDIGVTGFDHFLPEDLDGIKLDTFDVDVSAMAEISLNTLLRKIDRTHFIPRLRVVSGTVIEGNSFLKKRERQV